MAPKSFELAGVDSSSAHSVKAPLTCLTVRQIKIIEPTDPILGNCSNISATQPCTGSHLSASTPMTCPSGASRRKNRGGPCQPHRHLSSTETKANLQVSS
ncbi:unnamed protein product [Prunus armeniaca]|uniref:Uncharacterized protein n=1 Tax=Prunus armeniaca TaxID=36596 RepID=A0A6J5XV17_PRUAR|nr:unnamed protein product [Prunus armeniaca]